MGEPKRRVAQRSAGAFLGPDGLGMIPIPVRTLSDEYRDTPAEPEDSDRVPEPEPASRAHRVMERLAGRSDHQD